MPQPTFRRDLSDLQIWARMLLIIFSICDANVSYNHKPPGSWHLQPFPNRIGCDPYVDAVLFLLTSILGRCKTGLAMPGRGHGSRSFGLVSPARKIVRGERVGSPFQESSTSSAESAWPAPAAFCFEIVVLL